MPYHGGEGEHNRNGASAAYLELQDTNRIHMVTETYFTYDDSFGDRDKCGLGASAKSAEAGIQSA